MTSPVDVHSANGGVEVKLYVRAYAPNGVPYPDSVIKSIRVIHVNSFCRIPPPSDFAWINQGVKVELYTGEDATGIRIGTVFYGHLVNRKDEGVYSYEEGMKLGNLGSQFCSNGGQCDCYPLASDHHVHMGRSDNGYTYYLSCNTPVNTSSGIYYWQIR